MLEQPQLAVRGPARPARSGQPGRDRVQHGQERGPAGRILGTVPGQQLLSAAREEDADLLVMGAYGHVPFGCCGHPADGVFGSDKQSLPILIRVLDQVKLRIRSTPS